MTRVVLSDSRMYPTAFCYPRQLTTAFSVFIRYPYSVEHYLLNNSVGRAQYHEISCRDGIIKIYNYHMYICTYKPQNNIYAEINYGEITCYSYKTKNEIKLEKYRGLADFLEKLKHPDSYTDGRTFKVGSAVLDPFHNSIVHLQERRTFFMLLTYKNYSCNIESYKNIMIEDVMQQIIFSADSTRDLDRQISAIINCDLNQWYHYIIKKFMTTRPYYKYINTVSVKNINIGDMFTKFWEFLPEYAKKYWNKSLFIEYFNSASKVAVL